MPTCARRRSTRNWTSNTCCACTASVTRGRGRPVDTVSAPLLACRRRPASRLRPHEGTILEELEPTAVPDTPAGNNAADNSAADNNTPTAESLLIQLHDFEGPLDLLLYLIQRDELDIYNIPISQITRQYLEYIDLLDVFDLDNAGEFLVMAATLMRIKARLLLPVTRPGEDEEDDIDPRDELVRRLLEYKKYKEAALDLAQKETNRAEYFGRGGSFEFLGDAEEEPVELSLSLFDLLGAVRNVLQEIRGDSTHRVYTEVYTVEAQEELILDRLTDDGRVRFEELFGEMKIKMEVVVTFVALLDLLKSGRIRANQSSTYGDIWLEAGEGDGSNEQDTNGELGEQDASGELSGQGEGIGDQEPGESRGTARTEEDDE
ncbi:hypothetical protein DRQ53_02100 [bacterium]|nr:MAG: hypothetical protein DRQ53_02100 [bacterium]